MTTLVDAEGNKICELKLKGYMLVPETEHKALLRRVETLTRQLDAAHEDLTCTKTRLNEAQVKLDKRQVGFAADMSSVETMAAAAEALIRTSQQVRITANHLSPLTLAVRNYRAHARKEKRNA